MTSSSEEKSASFARSTSKYLSSRQTGIGASYLLRQTAGSERVGGLQVTLTTPATPRGTIHVVGTLYRSELKMESSDEIYAQKAIEGIRQYAQTHQIDLQQLDIQLDQFLIHPVDSRASVFFFTAQHAFQAAIAALTTVYSL